MDTKPASLDEIAGLMDMQTSEMTYYFDRETGDIVLVTYDTARRAESDEPLSELPVWQREEIEIARSVERNEGDRYVSLPTEFEIHAWSMMERFALSYPDDRISDALYEAIHGSGAFRFFRSTLRRLNIEDEWYAYKDEALREMAAGWCEVNDIPYEKD